MTKDKQKISWEDVLEVLKGFIQQNAEHLEKMEKNIRKDIKGVEGRLDARIDNVEKGMERLNSKFERLERKMDVMTEALQARMGEQERELSRVREHVGMTP